MKDQISKDEHDDMNISVKNAMLTSHYNFTAPTWNTNRFTGQKSKLNLDVDNNDDNDDDHILNLI